MRVINDLHTSDLLKAAGAAALHAPGDAGSCAWCDMRGLCRKGAW